MIEHFSKWIELDALYCKSSEVANYAFLDRIWVDLMFQEKCL
jgi:hypothetical protein